MLDDRLAGLCNGNVGVANSFCALRWLGGGAYIGNAHIAGAGPS